MKRFLIIIILYCGTLPLLYKAQLIISVADADSSKTPSTEPVTAPVQAPLSQEESGHGNAQQGTQPTLS